MSLVPRRKSLVLFDLDGVIVDSRSNMEAAWAAVRRDLGVGVPFSAYFAEIGRPFQDIMARLGLAHQGRRIEAAYRRASSLLIAESPIFDGVEAMLATAAASGVKLGIVTSKDSARTQLVLDRLDVSFMVVMTPEDRLRGKPAPDHLLYAMATCNIDPVETIFVGDMESDAEAARRAGIDYAHAEWGYGERPAQCAFVAETPAMLTTQLFG
ncbi:HAD family hydrolase [Jiella sonneratiae]|uniref:phosphoglycolate phosphatase n=1 Tax=Jiella sonneratiae TaxID=2816856 RepID=A0ABS3J3B8_9HYPH|nr:HAD family hydrolase [Jiella sonneratiae]MBO0904152.1 HAD family hydrolase [Jiella sonneratiae]